MLRLALLSGRGRLGTFTGALVALTASSALVMAGAMPLEAALRTHPPVERYAAAAAVVTGQQIAGADHDVPLGERARGPSARPRRPAGGAPPRPPGSPRPPGGRPRRPRRDRRRVGAGQAGRPRHRRPRVE